MSAIASVLVGVAAQVGAPIVKGILEKYTGKTGAAIGGAVIDAIAEKAGVPAEQLPTLPEAELGKAVLAVEESPELIAAQLEHHRLAIELQKKEMDDGPVWSWAWRPGGMYLLGVFWFLYIAGYPALNLFLQLFGASARIEPFVDIGTLIYISGGFMTLYMGGNTFLRGLDKWKGR